jgi:murein DD-endopeptidase MepM/ murein hydrolase activator NlpD
MRVPRRPRSIRRRDLVWPTAKAGIAVTVVLGLTAGLGSLLGLPVPGLNTIASQGSPVSSATLFGVGPGTAPGLAGGYVFPVGGPAPHDYGEAAAKFGADRYGHIHQGQDVFAKPGTPLVAVRDGIVLDGGGGKSFYSYGGGNTLVMYSPADDRSYVYLHMLKPSPLSAGDEVRAGQVVGEVGCTGSCYGPHLHFEIRRGKVAYGHEGKPIDPLPYLRQWERLGTSG